MDEFDEFDTVPLTIRQVAAAMIKDETPQAFGILSKFGLSDDAVKGLMTCAIGGAAHYLNVDESSLETALTNERIDKELGGMYWDTIGDAVIEMNDSDHVAKATIGRRLMKMPASILDRVIQVEKV